MFEITCAMRVLIICHSYAPQNDPRALRWTALSEEWIKSGFEVHVLTAKPVGQATHEMRNGVSVHRVGWRAFNVLKQWATEPSAPQELEKRSHAALLAGTRTREYSLATVLRKTLREIYDLTWKQLFWPDATCLWILPAARYARRLSSEHKFDVLVSVSHPFSGHVVGLLVRRGRPRLAWLADSGDPFAFSKESAPNNFRLWERMNFWIEKKVINAAAAFSVTTEETAKLYRHYFPENANKMIVIPPLLQSSLQDAISTTGSIPKHDDIVMLFVGMFYKTVRRPEPLLELFEAILSNLQNVNEALKLQIIGPVDIVAEALQKMPSLNDKVILLGKMPHDKAVKAMLSADCLVNVGNSTHYQLPSKIIEYMATGKPILNISSISNDSSSQVLKNYPLSYLWGHNNENDLDDLCRFLKSCRGRTLSVEHRVALVAPFSVANVSAQYLTALSGGIRQAVFMRG